MTKYYSTTETAKLIRSTLKQAFPGIKFSVRSDKYAGGSSIRVSWIDGPTQKDVDAIASGFSGSGFDGMTDCKHNKDNTLNGEAVSFGVDFIFCDRDTSKEFQAKCFAAWKSLNGQQQCDMLNNSPVHYTFYSWGARTGGLEALTDGEIAKWMAANCGMQAQKSDMVATSSSDRYS
jgi:hypothetical protein